MVVVGLVVAVSMFLAPAAGGVLAQEHPDALDAPHPAGVTETPFGAAATACELPTGSPRLAEGDLSAPPSIGPTGGAPVATGAPAPGHEALDAPHPPGMTETPYGALATECGQPTE
jgi:hypothetical protein